MPQKFLAVKTCKKFFFLAVPFLRVRLPHFFKIFILSGGGYLWGYFVVARCAFVITKASCQLRLEIKNRNSFL